MLDDLHPNRTYDVDLIASNLPQMHDFVARKLGRIEMIRPGSDQRCVLISKDELDSLERALEILSDTDDMRDIRGKIAALAAATGPVTVANA